MADAVTDPTVTGNSDSSFSGDGITADITTAVQTAGAAFGAYQKSQTQIQQSQIGLQTQYLTSNTWITLGLIIAAVVIIPRLLGK